MINISKITLNSSAYDIVADITQKGLTGKIRWATKDDLDLAKYRCDYHAYDFGQLMNSTSIQVSLGIKAIRMWCTIGLTPPFSNTTFLFRLPDALIISAIEQSTREIIATVFTWNSSNMAWDTHYRLTFDRHGPKQLDTSDSALSSIALKCRILSRTGLNTDDIRIAANNFQGRYLLPSFALLAEKRDIVWTEPATWTHIDSIPLKGYQRPPPSVSVVFLNTDRFLRPPTNDDGTGLTVRPHDRRAHQRRRGNKLILVKSCKIHGGSPNPVVNTVKLQNSL